MTPHRRRRSGAIKVVAVAALLAASLLVASATEDASASAVDDQAKLPPWLRNKSASSSTTDEIPSNATVKAPVVAEEESKIDSNADARVAFTNIVVFPDGRQFTQRQQIGIKNMGTHAIDLTGWRLTNAVTNDTSSGFVFGAADKCKHRKIVVPAKGTAEYLTKDHADRFPCVLNFKLAKGDTLQLFDSENNLKANLKIDFAGSGEYRLSPDQGDYWHVPYAKDRTLMETLDSMGRFKHFTAMLRKFQYDRALAGLGRKRWQSCGAVAYYPYYACRTDYDQEYDIYYRNAPFTVLAPTDEAVDRMLKEVGGTYAPALSLEEFMALDEGNMAKDLLKYHVIKGHELTTRYRQPNSTLPYNHLPTHRNNSEIVSFGGDFDRLCIHEDCVESNVQDEFGCKMQVEWDKCGEDWMNDAGLFSKRELGYCEVSCGRCKNTPSQCKDVPIKDIKAKNGVLHVLDHVLPIPDLFPEYVPPPPEPEPEPEPADILNQMPTYGDLGLTRENQQSEEQTIEDLIELYLASRRNRRARDRGASTGGGMVLDGLGK